MIYELQIQKEIQSCWSDFKVIRNDSIKEHDLKLGFRFIILYFIFKKFNNLNNKFPSNVLN